jgi:hypothetical protein
MCKILRQFRLAIPVGTTATPAARAEREHVPAIRDGDASL